MGQLWRTTRAAVMHIICHPILMSSALRPRPPARSHVTRETGGGAARACARASSRALHSAACEPCSRVSKA